MTRRASTASSIDAADGVLRIRLDRPERKNALDVAAIARIVDALEDAATDDSLRAVVLAQHRRRLLRRRRLGGDQRRAADPDRAPAASSGARRCRRTA